MTKVELYKSRPFVTCVHLIALIPYYYAVFYFQFHIKLPSVVSPGHDNSANRGKAGYLTYWCLIIQALYFTISLANDFTGTNEVNPRNTPQIRKLKDYILASLAFPVAFVVGVSFWTIWAIDRELIFPRAFDAFFPSWLNHVMHTNIMVFMLLEMFTSFRTYPERKKGLLILISFMAAYLVWIHIIKYVSGYWVYPILEVLQLPQRIVFFAIVLVITVFLYMFGEFLNNKIWTKELKYASRKIK